MFSVPSSRNSSATWLRRLASTDATSTTVTMPMTMPTLARIDATDSRGWRRGQSRRIRARRTRHASAGEGHSCLERVDQVDARRLAGGIPARSHPAPPAADSSSRPCRRTDGEPAPTARRARDGPAPASHAEANQAAGQAGERRLDQHLELHFRAASRQARAARRSRASAGRPTPGRCWPPRPPRPAAPSARWGRPRRRCVRRGCRTKLRAASGVRMSKASGWPGRSWRRARMPARATSSAVLDTCTVPALREDLHRRRRAERPLEGLQRHVDVAVERHAPARALRPHRADDAKPRPPMRTVWPSGSEPGNSVAATSAPSTTTCAARCSSSRTKNRPVADVDVANLRELGAGAVDRRPPRSARCLPARRRRAARSAPAAAVSPATWSRNRTSDGGSAGCAAGARPAPATQLPGTTCAMHEGVAAEGARAGGQCVSPHTFEAGDHDHHGGDRRGDGQGGERGTQRCPAARGRRLRHGAEQSGGRVGGAHAGTLTPVSARPGASSNVKGVVAAVQRRRPCAGAAGTRSALRGVLARQCADATSSSGRAARGRGGWRLVAGPRAPQWREVDVVVRRAPRRLPGVRHGVGRDCRRSLRRHRVERHGPRRRSAREGGRAGAAGQVLARLDPVQARSQSEAAQAQVHGAWRRARRRASTAGGGSCRPGSRHGPARAEARANRHRIEQLFADRWCRPRSATRPWPRRRGRRPGPAAEAAVARADETVVAAPNGASAGPGPGSWRRRPAGARPQITAPIDGLVRRLQVRRGRDGRDWHPEPARHDADDHLGPDSTSTPRSRSRKPTCCDCSWSSRQRSHSMPLPGRRLPGQVIEIGTERPAAAGGRHGHGRRPGVPRRRPHHRRAGLRPGLTCDAEILTDSRTDAIVAPLQAVVLRAAPGTDADRRACSSCATTSRRSCR